MHASNRHGFTLIELVVTIVILTLLVGIAVPVVGTLQDDAKVAKILQAAETMRGACARHYADTGALAIEQSGQAGAAFHRLSLTQTTAGWKGPYMDHPLTEGDNPFAGAALIYDTFNGGIAVPFNNGFRITGQGGPNITGAGQFLAFTQIPQKIAQAVNDAMDKGLAGNWQQFGRVQYRPANGGTLMIFLMDT